MATDWPHSSHSHQLGNWIGATLASGSVSSGGGQGIVSAARTTLTDVASFQSFSVIGLSFLLSALRQQRLSKQPSCPRSRLQVVAYRLPSEFDDLVWFQSDLNDVWSCHVLRMYYTI